MHTAGEIIEQSANPKPLKIPFLKSRHCDMIFWTFIRLMLFLLAVVDDGRKNLEPTE
jgi:hypothetical protein